MICCSCTPAAGGGGSSTVAVFPSPAIARPLTDAGRLMSPRERYGCLDATNWTNFGHLFYGERRHARRLSRSARGACQNEGQMLAGTSGPLQTPTLVIGHDEI